jgi:hypothetical protein
LYDTPRGDVIVEMPLYDFEPYHFSKNGTSVLDDPPPDDPLGQLGRFIYRGVSGMFEEQGEESEADAVQDALDRVSMVDDQRYEWDLAVFPFEQISLDIASSEQDVKTAFIVHPRIYAAQADDQHKTAKKGEIAVALNLIPLYGIRVEQGDTYGAITSPEAARVFANIMLNRTNADTTNLRVPCMPNFAAWPNRPVWIMSRNVIATTKSIAHTIAWQSDINTDYGLWHCKFWDGRFTEDNGVFRPLFVPFGGVNARPFNYAYLLGIRDREKDASQASSSVADALLSVYKKSGRR